ncbi:hypothetical protein CYMTET_23939 [Cymbomonas tetramitiformis]|uniref:Dynein heavy chain n=1 Tax=Cymbomonas tetramitiformis TaxID=36881 RepID=A0AAE0FWW9_9CHLO|nr:hypothetical protein CYMTET_23939 [Cymbomonas tetramitiformis]
MWRGVRYEEDPVADVRGIHGSWHPEKTLQGGQQAGFANNSFTKFPKIGQHGNAPGKMASSMYTLQPREGFELTPKNKKNSRSASNIPALPSLKTSPPTGVDGLTGTKRKQDGPSPLDDEYEDDEEMEDEEGEEFDLLSYIKTGDDVVEFYARNGKESEVKFFYCNRADTGIQFRPYDLEVVSREEAGPEYFTLSASGVVHIKPGAHTAGSEFTALGEWMREKSIFNVLTRMKFFKHYLVYKTFHIWRSSVRKKLFCQVRNRLTRRLFLAKPTFCPSLMELQGYVYELSEVRIMMANGNHLYNLDEYAELQISQRQHKAAPALEAAVERVQQVLEKICREVTKQARLYQESIRNDSELEDKTGVNLYQGRPADKSRSMVSIKKEKIERAKTYRRVAEEAKMLGDFIRLADYMLVEGVVGRAINTVAELLDLLESARRVTDKTSKGVFLTTVSFSDTAKVFTPTEQDVLNVLNQNVIEGTISTVQGVPRLLYMRSFSHYFDGKMNGLNPVQIIRSTPRFKELRQKIDSVIVQDFQEAREYSEIFEEHRVIYEFGKSWNQMEYTAQKLDLRKYHMDMSRQREWRNELERMKIGNVIGTLHVDSKSLRNSLVPITTRTLDTIKGLLLNSSRDEVIAALANFQQRCRTLQERPENLDGFVTFMVTHTEMLGKKKAALTEAQVVDEMYELLTSYEMKVPTSDQVKLDDLHEAVDMYKELLDEADVFIEERKQGMMATLDKNITNLNEELLAVLGNLHSGSFVEPESDPAEVVAELELIRNSIANMRQKSETYQGYQKLFNMTVDDFSNLALTEKECGSRYNVWKLLYDFETNTHAWTTGDVKGLEILTITSEVETTATSAYKMGKANKEDRVVYRLKDEVDEFKQIMPLIEELANVALKDRHWKEIFSMLPDPATGKVKFSPEDDFSVKDLIELNVMGKMEEVQRISTNASKEHSLENALVKMVEDWNGIEFKTIAYKDTGTFTLGGTDDMQALLDDQIVKIQSMRASPFIKPFQERASNWEDTLQTLQDLLDNWISCQATWQYLEPIFSSEDIMKQMPEEGQQFQAVDQIYRDMMTKANKAPAALGIARDKEQLELLVEANAMLDSIQKGLAAYLEVKRIAFPRFFFLSNDEMLEILSETKDPTRVQPHLKKCFEGIAKLRFEENTDITGMVSAETELVPFKSKVEPSKTGGAVEKWLVQVESCMVEALNDVCNQSVQAYAAKSRDEWVLEWPGQIVLVVSAIYWTTDVTEALKAEGEYPGSVKGVRMKNTSQLENIIELVRGNLSKLNRKTLEALVVMDVHARDVVAQLAADGISRSDDFSWQSQLRMYWEDETCNVCMMNATIEYGYEYLGNSGRLVVTPLTDRCYRTLMGAIHLNLGGAPEGPAGTGKTETTKDLAKALARQCVVFNCSDTLDYITMAKFFKGLASSGAWACFDEFNRINLEVLSVVAQQVLEIQLAVKNKVKSFFFEGSDLPLRPTCNAFITMNPGYAGRSELPDNLKALFRTVAMMVPDYAMIAEIMLYSNGYLVARDCARKIVTTYKLCSEQLSSQDHYDYGMRAVMAVLRAAGNMKRKYTDEDEFVLMLRSIIDVNLCKFLSHDVPLFNGIVSDLFPGVVLPDVDYTNLKDSMKLACEKFKLQFTDYFVLKCIQLYEMIVVRHGLMIVGLSFSGKSCCLKVLADALTDLFNKGLNDEYNVKTFNLNPKSVTMGQLYGETDRATQEWKDGNLGVGFRQMGSDQSDDRKWMILDGPVDAIWIENMNTVLDDNKKLCLPNSEIIAMAFNMNMIFEVADLAVASPATVSRCGMVYLEPHQLGWEPLMHSWKVTLPLKQKVVDHVVELFNWLVPACLRFVVKSVREISPTGDANLVQCLMRVFDAQLTEFRDEETAKTIDPVKTDTWVDSIFILSLVWSLGGSTNADGRRQFDEFIRVLCSGAVPEGFELYVPAKHTSLLAPMIPDDNGSSVYDYVFNKERTAWQLWTDTITPEQREIPSGTPFSRIIVPTKDSSRYTYLLDLAIKMEMPILFCGPTGTGKSVYVNRYLMQLPKEKFLPINITFSARTSANMTQEQVDGRLDKRKKGTYGPPINKKAIVFVDDLNMPAKEVYGAQPPIELLRQFMDYKGWYGRDNLFRSILDMSFVCAMGPAGGGRTEVTGRYLRHFNLLSVAEVADTVLTSIFNTVLSWYLKDANFSKEIQGLSEKVINATLHVYSAAMNSLLPTPSKSHYVFNLRDFARVVQGVMLQDSKTLPQGPDGKEQHIRLWIHEVLRVFYDRLTDKKDQNWLLNTFKQLLPKYFETDFDALLSYLSPNPITIEDLRRLFFGDYMDPDKGGEDQPPREYEQVNDTIKLMSVMEEYLVDYNGMSKRPMNLAMFLFAVEHVSRICRILKQPGGHMLLVGVGGSGRQSLTRLGASINFMEVIQVEISKSYGITEWRDDLKNILRKSGAQGNPTVFLFSDTQIKDEAFVEDINNVLNAGEVPNMFPNDEKMQVIETVRPIAAKLGLQLETQMELWSFFTQRCKDILHICLCFSPIGAAFRDRLRQYPSLVNCCTIDWFQEWPADALEAVATKFLKEMDLTEDHRTKMVQICKGFHKSVVDASLKFKDNAGRQNYVTPTSYLELISTYKTLLKDKRDETTKAKNRYIVGLEKLKNSAEQVAGMQEELTALKPQLIKTVGEVEEMMKAVEKEKKEVVEPKKAVVQVEEAEAAKQAAEAKGIKDDCEGVLAEAMPALNDAISALDTLKPADINYIKKLSNPPYIIKLVMEGVCVLLGEKGARVKDDTGKMVEDYWKTSVALLNNDKEFIARLRNYDKDNISPKVIAKIRENYITNEQFSPDKASNASSAAEGLCKWVYAMDKYDKVAKVVAPKQAQLKIAEAAYEEVMVSLRQKQTELKALLDKLAGMEEELRLSSEKKNKLSDEVDLCTVKLERAEKLINGLGGERSRWTEVAGQLAPYRDELVDCWVDLCAKANIPRSQVFSLNTVLGNPVKVREWLIAGLPNDSFSVDNGIIVANARRWPLMIDPQGQANKWVKNMERSNNLQVVKLSESGEHLRTLENAIQFGLPVLLENVGEELDPSLEPLLLKQVFKSGGVNCIRLGDATIEYSSDFRFYITTKLRNPHYLPETSVKVTLLNFMITPEGLSDQLLGVVVAKERPDLEEQKNQLVVEGAENKRKLKEIEDKILEVLSNSEGNILEDETAISIITEAKVLGNDIAQKQVLAEKTEKEIDDARRNYKPCGEYTAVLFFCISDLCNIEPMYQYSLPWFVNLFISSISNSMAADDVAIRLNHIQDHYTFSLYQNVCRSLFEKDKLLFSFLLTTRILGSKGMVDQAEWMFLLTGGLGGNVLPKPPGADWLSDPAWAELCRLSAMPAYQGLTGSFLKDASAWKPLHGSLDPHKENFPGTFNSLDSFKKLLLVRSVRPDKVIPAVQDFVTEILGLQFVQPPLFNLGKCYADSSPVTPLIFVLSPGSDPSAALIQFAEDKEMASRINFISLGQGQGPKAAKFIDDGTKLGSWVVLQNCHLAPSWMPALERLCEEFDIDAVHSDFRLWCTSYPSPVFPVSILQNGVKMTNEPPKGLRANMKRSYTLEPIANEEFFEGCNKPHLFKALLFGLVFFHAQVQERRKFGPLGWNIPYSFDDGDLRISVRQLHMFLNQAEDDIPYAALKYVTGECNYGGRVTDDKDRRLLNTVLEKVFCQEIDKNEGYKLTSSGLYYAPNVESMAEVNAYIESLPIIPLPEAFGLHENADISKDKNDTTKMCASLLLMSGSGGGGGGAGAAAAIEAQVGEIVKNVINDLMPAFDIETVQRKYPVLYEQSMNTVLAQEMSRFNKLTNVIRKSMKEMEKAIAGLVVMSSDLEEAFFNISIGQTPALWMKASYPSMKPLGGYLIDLYARLNMLETWFQKGTPSVFWVSGFYFTQSFLTAANQNFARKYKIPIDEIAFDFEVIGMNVDDFPAAPEDGVYIHGMYLEGCAFDAKKKMLCESEPKILYSPGPLFWLKPSRANEITEIPCYNCPVYRTLERRGVLATTGHSTNFVMFMRIPTDQSEVHWIMRGVAMFCSLSE